MKTIRLIALLALVFAGACAQSPTAPAANAADTQASMDGTGMAGGGTR